MHLKSINIIKSPDTDGRIRLVGEVTYDEKTWSPELYWFDFPEQYAEDLSKSGNPWLACLIPLAVTIGEPLHICEPVDRVLYDNVQELMQIWKCWSPSLKVVPVEAELIDSPAHKKPASVAAFFSGGVDSFFTVLRYEATPDRVVRNKADDLLCVWGFDVPLYNREAFYRMREKYQLVASHLNKNIVDVATNLRQTRAEKANWSRLNHGCALASVALALENRYERVLIGSTRGYNNLIPWGSHPLTDPLLSTARTRIIHDGAAFTRLEKTAYIAASEVAMHSLRVCWEDQSDRNCCACNKCYRTMVTLAVLESLDQCTTFRHDSFKLEKMATLYSNENERFYLSEVRNLAVQQDKMDIAKALERGLKYSVRLDRIKPIIKWMEVRRFGWRSARMLESVLKRL